MRAGGTTSRALQHERQRSPPTWAPGPLFCSVATLEAPTKGATNADRDHGRAPGAGRHGARAALRPGRVGGQPGAPRIGGRGPALFLAGVGRARHARRAPARGARGRGRIAERARRHPRGARTPGRAGSVPADRPGVGGDCAVRESRAAGRLPPTARRRFGDGGGRPRRLADPRRADARRGRRDRARRQERRSPAAAVRRRHGHRAERRRRPHARRRVGRRPVPPLGRRRGLVRHRSPRPTCSPVRPAAPAPWRAHLVPPRPPASWPPVRTWPSPTRQERVQFGRTIGTFQAVKHHCADMLVATQLATATVWDAAAPQPTRSTSSISPRPWRRICPSPRPSTTRK